MLIFINKCIHRFSRVSHNNGCIMKLQHYLQKWSYGVSNISKSSHLWMKFASHSFHVRNPISYTVIPTVVWEPCLILKEVGECSNNVNHSITFIFFFFIVWYLYIECVRFKKLLCIYTIIINIPQKSAVFIVPFELNIPYYTRRILLYFNY